MNTTIVIILVYIAVTALLYFLLKTYRPYDYQSTNTIKGKWLNDSKSIQDEWTEEEYEDTIKMLSLMWPCTITVAVCITAIAIGCLLTQMFKK